MFQTIFVEKFKIFIFNNFFFENPSVYEIKLKNIVEPGRPQMTTWRMRLLAGQVNLQTHPQNVQYYCFYTTAMVT
jgi:hypothetical protein